MKITKEKWRIILVQKNLMLPALKLSLFGGRLLEFEHKPVMLEECMAGLQIKPNGIYVDGTLGGAGHSKEIIKRLEKDGLLIGIDRDKDAITVAKERLKEFSNVELVHGNHDDIKTILENLNIEGVDGILFDLGVSSYQLDERNRGFSYMGEAALDMRMDQSQELSAKIIVNTYTEEALAEILWEYGEEKFAKRIAKNIVLARAINPIQTTKELTQIIEKSVPRKGDGHPAKRTFQAIRIEVNNEIKPLYQCIKDAIDVLNPKGRLCVITFHSLEDRAVKKAMAEAEGICTCPPGLPYCMCGKVTWGKVITKKPILPSKEEQETNTRSKSAKLRIFEKKGV